MINIFKKIKKEFDELGPGFVTGAADDDPSGIATYSIAGAQFGYQMSFLSWVLLPMMIAVQEACARIGMTSGMGLAGVLKKFYSKKLLITAVILLSVANIINIGADLGVMAATSQMVTGLPFIFWLITITVITILAEIFIPYKTYAKVLKITGLFLLVYVITAFLVTKDWLNVAVQTIIPHLTVSKEYLMTAVGFLGTTISPYLFFWQASEEVEEEIEEGKIKDFSVTKRPFVTGREIRSMRKDTVVGMFFSNIITLFIVFTTAATLHTSGITNITSPQEAALALRPLAGNFTYLLFTIGIVGIGLQSVPVLAGSVAYAIAETFGFKEGLFKTFNKAKLFYATIAVATLIGISINILGINAMQALYYAAVINGLVAVPLIFIILRLSDDKRVVGENLTPKKYRFFGWITFIFMFLAALFMFLSMVEII